MKLNKKISYRGLFLFFLISAQCYNLSSQKLDSLAFDNHLSVLDSLDAFQTSDDCIHYIDSISTSLSLSKDQQSCFNIIKGTQFSHQGKDSMAMIFIESENNYLHSIGDTTGLSYSNLLEAQGKLKEKKAEYEKAEFLYIQSKIITKKVLGEDHQTYALRLHTLGGLYKAMGQYEKAEPLLIQCKNITKKVFGEDHLSYASSLHTLGILFLERGQYEKAEPLLVQSKNITKKVLGKDHQTYALRLHTLGGLYLQMGQFEKAESFYIQSLKIRTEVLGKSHEEYYESLFGLASLYQGMGQFNKAEPLLIQAIKFHKEVLSENHPSYATLLNTLATLYRYIGQYSKAEPLYIQTININLGLLGENHPNYAATLNNLAGLYKKMGQYEKASPLYIQCMRIFKEVFGENHPNYATIVNNLGSLYEMMSQFEKAEPLYYQSNEIFKEVFGENHPSYATSLSNLARVQGSMGHFERAEPLYIQSIKISKEVLGENHPNYAKNLTGLADLYASRSQYEKAEPLYIQSIKINKEVLGENHPNYVSSLTGLAGVYRNRGQFKKSAELFIEENNLTKNLLIQAFGFQSEKERMLYHQRIINSFGSIKSIGVLYQSEELLEAIYNTLLFEKGLHLNSNIQTKAFIQAQEDSVVIKTYEDLIDSKRQLYLEYQKPISKQVNVDEIEETLEQLEKKLAKASALFRRNQEINKIDDHQIAQKLQEGEVAIEFTHFKKSEDTILYAACILHNSGDISFIPLTREKKLKRKLNLNGNGSSSYINTIYGYSERGVRISEDALPRLYEMIWKPIEPFLKGVNKIYYSPSGLLNRLNINAIAVDEQLILADKYNMVELMSTRSIAIEQEINTNNSAYTMGGVEYDIYDKIVLTDSISSAVDNDLMAFRSIDQSLTEGSWNFLQWTKSEAESINELLKDYNFQVEYKTSNQATEADFKSIGTSSPSPQVLHLATHGFFFPDPENNNDTAGKNTFEKSTHPLLRSGLVLAGGNNFWQGEEILPGNEDGILTAYEISNMNLTNTELVVLSACDTGLGDIQGREGVYGLQRSFKMAGVKYLIMSLWQVPDRATSVFMTKFYENYLKEKMTIRDAFNITQLEMRDRFFDPYNWAGFVLIE